MNLKKITTGSIATVFAFSCSLQNTHTTNEINKENMNFSTKAKNNYKVDLSNYNPKNKTDLENEKKIKTEKINKKLAMKKKFKFKTKACINTPITPISAGAIPINDPITFTLDNESKLFRFYAQSGQSIKINQSELDANDAYLRLYSPSNSTTPIEVNDDTFGLDSYIERTLTESGFYTIQVSTYEEATNCQSAIGNFKLSLESNNVYNPNNYTKRSNISSVMDKNGNYALVWQEYRLGTGWDILGQTFNKDGIPLSAIFQVNSDGNNIPGDQTNPAIAINRETGDFIVTWSGFGDFYYPTPETSAIFFKKYAINGNQITAIEPRVNQLVNGHQTNPDVTMDDDGNAVIVWETTGSTDNTDGIFMRRIYSNANFGGNQVKINETSINNHHPKVAITPNKNIPQVRQTLFVWEGNGTGDTNGLFQRKISFDYLYMDSEKRVNNFTTGLQSNPDLAFDFDGNAVVTWQTTGSTDNTDGIRSVIYDSNNGVFKTDTKINETNSSVSLPSVSINQSSGIHKSDFRIVWESEDPNLIYGGSSTIFQKWFNTLSTGDLSPEIRIYLPSGGNNGKPSISMNADSINDGNISDPFNTNMSKYIINWVSTMSTNKSDGVYNLPISSNNYGIYPISFIY